ncbi:mucin-5AC-like isoform X1 [Hippocampus zosterae]|uniref:mucin-5AC-like isoform X1 n=1 Tax=Hippocampus zosterae TaxID=109293 RepID=UPI00223D1DFF|nr:mucin-5AC-like isoform X1 [Hippocampus zosterae]
MTSPMMTKWLGITLVLLHTANHVQAGGNHKKCWTKWYNHDNPDNNGDYETLSKLRRENPMEICDVPIQIEARTLSGGSVDSTGETIHKSDTKTGFICRNVDQSRGICSDYEVRFLCPLTFCHPEECWTPWFDRDNPCGYGDFETLPDLHKEYPWKICKHPIKIQIKTTSGANVSSTGDVILAADTDVGFVCRNCDQPHDGHCADYKVRFLCPLEFCKPQVCKTPWYNRDNPNETGDFELLKELQFENPNEICPFPLDIEVKTVDGNSLSSTEDIIAVVDANTGFICKNDDQKSGTCSDYQVRFICPIDFCKEHECWTPWLDGDNPSGAGDYETISHLRHKYPCKICATPLQIEVQTIHGFSVAATGDVIHVADVETGFICQNYDQKAGSCSDYRVRFRCPLDFCNPPECWTVWFDVDDPDNEGDFEEISKIWEQFPSEMCHMPSSIEARTKCGASVDSTGDVIYIADTETGFICKNSDEKRCSDYEVRFKCPLTFCYPDVCYTPWFNHDDPRGTGDYELLSHLRPKNHICDNPVDIQVVTAYDNYPFSHTGQIPYIYSATEGFACRNEDQNNHRCYDYKVRFGCPCQLDAT